MKSCCEEMKKNINEKNIDVEKWTPDNSDMFFIYCKPEYEEGYGETVDVTDSIEIKFCPFCGSKL